MNRFDRRIKIRKRDGFLTAFCEALLKRRRVFLRKFPLTISQADPCFYARFCENAACAVEIGIQD